MALFSIGHSNLPAAELVRLLKQHRIAVLVDVRSRPFSRFNPQFNQSRLAETLEQAGIAYRWRGEYLGGRGDTTMDSPEFVAAMDEVIALGAERNVAVMCAEANPANCHRTSKLGAFLSAERAISLSHITAGGLLTQAQVTANDQPGLFDR
jgi:uncharacterized protein (DUF488 family)